MKFESIYRLVIAILAAANTGAASLSNCDPQSAGLGRILATDEGAAGLYSCDYSSEIRVWTEATYTIPDAEPSCGSLWYGSQYYVQISVMTDCSLGDCSTIDVYAGFDEDCMQSTGPSDLVGTINGDNKQIHLDCAKTIEKVCIRVVNHNSMFGATPAIEVMMHGVPDQISEGPVDPAIVNAMMTSDAEEVPVMALLHMADLVYDLEGSSSITRTSPVLEDAKFTVAKTMQSQRPEGLSGLLHLKDDSYKPAVAVWTREYPKQAVIAIKGTSPEGSASDDAADFKSIFLGMDFTMALERISELKTMYGSYNVLVTGHSLGGYLAELSSTHYNIPGIAFHGPAPGGDNGRYKNSKFFNINAEHDMWGNFGGYFHDHVGPVVRETGLGETGLDSPIHWSSHEIVNIISWWDSHGDSKNLLTNVNILDFCVMDDDGKNCHLPGRDASFQRS